MRLLLGLFTLAMASTSVAEGRTPPVGVTVVYLQADAQQDVVQDTLHANLQAEVTELSPRKAQAALNLLVSKALGASRGAVGISVTTGSYRVHEMHRGYDKNGNLREPVQWRAQQNIMLKGTDFANLLERMADLQDLGLKMQGMSFSLSSNAYEKTSDSLLEGALQELQTRAASIGKALGKPRVNLAEVHVNSGYNRPQPMVKAHMMRAEGLAMAADMPAPSAAAGETTVQVNVSAQAWLSQ